jgi:trk system potassium uptake protein TrkH
MGEVLRYAVRPRAIARHGGMLLLAAGGLTLVPAAFALFAGESALAPAFVGAALLLGVPGVLAARVEAPKDLRRNEALALVALVFLLVPLVTAWPLSQRGAPFLDAFFEAMSGITTTGLSTLARVEVRSRTVLFARSWMQWYGGFGIAALVLAFVARTGFAGRRLDVSPGEGDDLVSTTHAHARRILLVYGLLTAGGVALLLVLGADLFDAIVHTLSAVSTGGFSSRDASLGAISGWPERTGVLLLSLLGAISLSVHARVFRNGLKALLSDLEVRGLLLLCAVATLLLALVGGLPWGHAAVLGISAQTTTGFTSTDIRALAPVAKVVLILAMVGGGCVGSTAGGIKVLRLLIGLELARWMVRAAGMPGHAVHEPRLGGERLDQVEIQRACVVLLLFPCVIALSWIPFLALGHDPLDSLFEVASATGTVGLSAGIARPHLAPALKGVLCLDMWLGRLEIVAILVLFSPRTWLGRRAE